MSQPGPQRKLSAVPPAKEKSQQQKALAQIAKNKKKNKLGTYSDPAVRAPVLQSNDISRSATRQIEVPPPLTWWQRLRLRGSR